MRKLSLENFQCGYDHWQTKKINMDLDPGELVALVGKNGSGKSTLVKGMMSLLKSEGKKSLGDMDLSLKTTKEMAKYISFMPQTFRVTYPTSVEDIILMGFNPDMGIFENYSKKMKDRVRRELDDFGLLEYIHRDFTSLSEGEKQKVRLIRSLIRETPVLLLDEPESTLDFMVRHEMMELVLTETRKRNCISLLVIHDPNLALRYADRICLFKEGQVVSTINVHREQKESIEEKMRQVYGEVELIASSQGRLLVDKKD
ncbi:ABC transporter ATP-binding protein [Proteiniclasticum sp. C24MP]|uniref:ABC transporter ATP-binding protein n=1 Tax=Proteiniclasticum sp. C24MP TaxID=3374101 RepID=UPI0037545699